MPDIEKPPQPQSPQPQEQQLPSKSSKTIKQKQVIAEKVSGTVKWFNVKCGYGFINRNDSKEDVFVHQTAITRNNPRKAVRSVGDGEVVEFAVVVGEKGLEAAGVTGPDGHPVKGSPYAADKRRGFQYRYYNNQGGRRGEGTPRRGGMGRRGPTIRQEGGEGIENSPPQYGYTRRNFRGGRRGGNRGGYPRMRNHQQSQGQNNQAQCKMENNNEPPANNSSAQQQQTKPKDNTFEATGDESQI